MNRMIDDLLEEETIWRLEEKGRGLVKMESLAARDLPYDRTLNK